MRLTSHRLLKSPPLLPLKPIVLQFLALDVFNAFTTFDHTGYIVKSDSDYCKICFNTLVDMLLNSNFDKGEFKREKNVGYRWPTV